MDDFNQFKPKKLFTLDEYKAFVDKVKLVKFKHFQATGGRRFGEAERLNKLLIKDLPPLYCSKLPLYLLARCPTCGERVTEPVDTFSLSGIGWWISESRGFGWFGRAHRYVTDIFSPPGGKRFPEPSYQAECEHVRAVCYGVNLNGIIPDDIKPAGRVIIGSEKPGVLVPFMEQEGSFAVIHTLPVGRLDDVDWQPHYTAYFITYFNKNKDAYLQSLAPRDPYDPLEFFWPYELMDYDLIRWVKAGKLFWLGVEAEEYLLRHKPAKEFPYRKMAGLVGRWATHPEKGACLLPDMNSAHLDNPGHLAYRHIKPAEEKALAKQKFRSIRREQVARAIQVARQQGRHPHLDMSLARMDLTGMDLAGTIIRENSLFDTNLSRANLQGIEGQKINLHNANLSEANLSAANLDDAYVVGANLRGANLQRTSLKNANLRKADLRGADLSGSDLRDVDLSGANLSEIQYDQHTRWPAGFTPPKDRATIVLLEPRALELEEEARYTIVRQGNVSLGKEAELLDATIEDVSFSNQSFVGIKLVRCRFSRARFENCDFTGALLIDSTFETCAFINCEFHKADFCDANCMGVNFSNSRLTRADLSGAIFKNTNLTNCDLSWAWLVKTDLREANLEGVTWEGTRLVKTKVYNRQRFQFGAMSRMIVEDIDVSEAGDGLDIRQADGLQMLMQDRVGN